MVKASFRKGTVIVIALLVVLTSFMVMRPGDDEKKKDIYSSLSKQEYTVDDKSTFLAPNAGGHSMPDIGLGYYYPALCIPEVSELFIKRHLIPGKHLYYQFPFEIQINGTIISSEFILSRYIALEDYENIEVKMIMEMDQIDENLTADIMHALELKFDDIQLERSSASYQRNNGSIFIIEERDFKCQYRNRTIASFRPRYDDIEGDFQFVGIYGDEYERVFPNFNFTKVEIDLSYLLGNISLSDLETNFGLEDFSTRLGYLNLTWPDEQVSEVIRDLCEDAEYMHYWELDPNPMSEIERYRIRAGILSDDFGGYLEGSEVELRHSEKFDEIDFLRWCGDNLPGDNIVDSIEKVSKYLIDRMSYISYGEGRYICGDYAMDLTYALELAGSFDDELSKIIPWYTYSGSFADHRGAAHAWVCLIAKGKEGNYQMTFLDPTHADTKMGFEFNERTFIMNLDAMDDDHYFSLFLFHVPDDMQGFFMDNELIGLERKINGIDLDSQYDVWIEGIRSEMTGEVLINTIREFVNHSIILDSGDEIRFVHPWTFYHEYNREVTTLRYENI